MKLFPILGVLALAASIEAQYFSAGWEPGQLIPEQASPLATSVPEKKAPASNRISPSSIASHFDLNKLLTSEPAAYLFGRFGINITEKIQALQLSKNQWDERIPLITDDNYKDLIVNEPLTEEEEKERTWIIVITVPAARQDAISKFMDDVFDSTFNETQVAGDLPNLRWGRIDYFNVTTITTKWAMWQAPYLVVLRDRGQTLRFYRPQHLRLSGGAMRSFLEQEGWKDTPPWTSPYAPGGSREFIMTYFAFVLTKIYHVSIMVPRWLLFIISGSVASVVMNLMHRGSSEVSKPKSPQPTTSELQTTKPTKPASQPAHSAASPLPARKRKTKK